MNADGIALGSIADRTHDGTTQLGVARAPNHRRGSLPALGGVRIQSDVSHVLSKCPRGGKAMKSRLCG